MIRFVYPNVNDSEAFIGCGRYLTTFPDDRRLKDGYRLADPRLGNLSKVTTAVSMLARDAFDSEQEVYEYKDQPQAFYLGDSMGLAYLLALIKRSRPTRWDDNEGVVDIWCTGTITMQGTQPCVDIVYHNLFDHKLAAFLADPQAMLFLVPVANLKSAHTVLCKQQAVALLSVEQFENTPFTELTRQKTLVRIHSDELERLVQAIFREPRAMDRNAPPPDVHPYRGLGAFQEYDARFFFGRETYVRQAIERLRQTSLLAIVGASGSGKSSLVHAGVLPQLRQQAAWRTLVFRPGEHPLKNLARILVPLLYDDELLRIAKINELAEQLLQRVSTVRDILDRIIEKQGGTESLLLFADQFEELYTLCRHEEERLCFLDNVVELAEAPATRSYRCILTMRADFLGKALTYRPFANVLQHAMLVLGPMNRQELKAAIEQPAETCGVDVEGGLTDRIIEGVLGTPGNLPLLEFALTELWEKQSQRMLTHAAYDDIGGVEHALTVYASHVYAGLTPDEQQRARKIFTQLVRPGEGTEDTRRVATRAEIGEHNWALVLNLADKRLIVTDSAVNSTENPTQPTTIIEETVEVIHEALITKWQHLREWIDADRKFRMWQEHLRSAMQQWHVSQRDDGALLRGVLLSGAEGWLDERAVDIPVEEQEFIKASLALRNREIEAQETQRRRELEQARQLQEEATRHAATQRKAAHRLKLLSVVVLVIAALAIVQWRQAEQQRRIAERSTIEALSVSGKALFLASDELGALVTLIKASQLVQRRTVSEELQALTLANFQMLLENVHEKNRLQASPAPILTIASSADGTLLASGNAEGEITLWQTQTGKALTAFSAHDGAVSTLSSSPDGRLLASGSFDKTIKLWRLPDGQAVQVLPEQSGFVYSVAFSPDGQQLAAGNHDQSITLWNVTTGTLTRTLQGHTNAVACLAFSPDGALLASGSDDHSIRLWQVNDGQMRMMLSGHEANVSSVTFSPDGKMLASGSGDRTVKLWNVNSGQVIATLQGHADFVTSVAFASDGLSVVSGSNDQTVKLWSVVNGTVVLTLTGHTEAVHAVAFTPDGTRVISASQDQTLRIWQIANEAFSAPTIEQLLAAGCQWVADYLHHHPGMSAQDRMLCDGY